MDFRWTNKNSFPVGNQSLSVFYLGCYTLTMYIVLSKVRHLKSRKKEKHKIFLFDKITGVNRRTNIKSTATCAGSLSVFFSVNCLTAVSNFQKTMEIEMNSSINLYTI